MVKRKSNQHMLRKLRSKVNKTLLILSVAAIFIGGCSAAALKESYSNGVPPCPTNDYTQSPAGYSKHIELHRGYDIEPPLVIGEPVPAPVATPKAPLPPATQPATPRYKVQHKDGKIIIEMLN